MSGRSERTNRLFSRLSMVATMGAAFLSFSSLVTCQTGNATSDWKQVEEAMGRPGQGQPGDVLRFGMPRKDLHVVLDGVEIKAGLALGSQRSNATALRQW